MVRLVPVTRAVTLVAVVAALRAAVGAATADPRVTAVTQTSNTHRLTDTEHMKMAERLEEYHIAYPNRVDRDGRHLTYDVTRTYDVTYLPRARHTTDGTIHRKRRSTRQRRKRRRRRDRSTHYRLHLGPSEEEVVLDLLPNRRMLAPGFVTEWRRKGDWLGRIRRPRRHCLLQGRVRDRPGSRVALTTCRGLYGYIHTGEHQYLLEPVKGPAGDRGAPRPHVVYKRRAPILPQPSVSAAHSGITDEPQGCSVNDSAWRRYRHRRRANGHSRGGARHPRRRRSVSAERNVETFIVADQDMVQFYADDDIETYLLTVMNGVSQLYHDASIGNAINVILVRIMILESTAESSMYFNISEDGDSSLKSFCNWQSTMNPSSESHPHHHDVAVLLTRRNICSENQTCNTLGLAEVAGMCQPSRSCNINQDTGLSVSYTIAHELGHNFGMNHDGPSNGCDRADGHRQHVMAPDLVSDVTPVVWSRCSRRDITKFLDRDWGHCLDDQPSDLDYNYPEVPPGALYDADHQCKLLYGPAASHCHMGNLCETLWCSVQQRCVTKLQPAAEGTRCTAHTNDVTGASNTSMWCSAGKCVEARSRPGAVDGGWGAWGAWGACSRSCGTGVQSSERHCDRPVPAHGGKYCVGERRRYRTCAPQDCVEESVTFRAQQCAGFNSVPYQGGNYSWTPVHDQAAPCQLTCRPEGQHFTAVLSDAVTDGTPCRLGSDDICINGKCRRMGCDGVLGSEARADRCGKCHGSGSLCHTVRHTFSKEHGNGYAVVVGVPAGARSIKMEEDSSSNTSFLAVTGVDGETGFLNDKWFVQWSGEYAAAGSVLYYFRDDHNETLFIPGPITQPIVLKVLLQESGTSVRYEYTVPGHEGTTAQVFTWQQQSWSECSVKCGGGEQTSSAVCMEDEAGRVEDIYCTPERPQTRTRPCNTDQCPPRWWRGPWQPCSAHCGQPGRRKRQVVCVRSSGADSITHSLGECDNSTRPSAEELCETPPEDCPARWQVAPWNYTECTVSPCRLRYRAVWCAPGARCPRDRRPASVLTCDLVQCRLRRHNHGRSQTRHNGRVHRRRRPHTTSRDAARVTLLERAAPEPPRHHTLVHSADEAAQLVYSRDEEVQLVHYGDEAVQLDQRLKQLARAGGWHVAAGNYSWKVEAWGECSVQCGEGRKERPVLCLDATTGDSVELSRCPWPVPHTDAPCTQPCLDWVTDQWAPCSSLCGDGLMTRQVTCPQPSRCDLQKRPLDSLPCRQPPCAQWQTGEWKPCSISCGSGYSMRSARCVRVDTGAPATGCPAKKPVTKKACQLPTCPTDSTEDGGRNNCVDTIKRSMCKNMIKLCSKVYFRAKCCATCAEHV